MFIRTNVRLRLFLLLFACVSVTFCNAKQQNQTDSPETLATGIENSQDDIHDEDNNEDNISIPLSVASLSTEMPNISVSSPPSSSTTTSTTTEKSTTKRRTSAPTSNGNRNNKVKNRRRKTHPQNLSSKNALVEFVPDLNDLKPEQTCLIGDVCMRNGKLGYCYKPHEPIHYERDSRDTEDFYEMMQESCAHFFDTNDNLKHPLCCSPEQEETIARLNANIDLIRKSCPSCLYNVKRLFCNIFCAPNQRDFLRVERVKGETVMDVTMAISSEFVSTFFSSCRDVRVFGAYLLDYDYGCGKHRRANCTAVEFIKVLGGLSEIPFNFKSLIVDPATQSERKQSQPNAWPTALMNDTAYNCYEAPPNQASCHCDHCPKSCTASQRPSHMIQSSQYNNNHNNYNTQSSKMLSRRSSSSPVTLSSHTQAVWITFSIVITVLFKNIVF